jgi:membrane fusion protein (multidrug efflux system)
MLVAVEQLNLVERIEATGELVARSQAKVAAEVAGRVTAIRVDEGQSVEMGTVVLEIDPEKRQLETADARAALGQAESALEEAERELRRIEQIHSRGAAADARLDQTRSSRDQARARADSARARLGTAERALRDASVVAPFSGIVARRMISAGEFVGMGQPLFDLVALEPIEVEFHVPEVDSGRIEVGHRVGVQVAPYPGERFEAEVTVVSPNVDSRTRTLRVKGVLSNADGRLRPGLFARVDVGVSQRGNVLMVPEEAVLRRADGAVVFRLADSDHVERRVVQIGVIQDGWIEIREGLAPGDFVVARGHSDLVDGSRISPRRSDGQPVSLEELRRGLQATP